MYFLAPFEPPTPAFAEGVDGIGKPLFIDDGITPVDPLKNAAIHVSDVGKALLSQRLGYFLTTVAYRAIHHDGLALCHVAEGPQVELLVAYRNGPGQVAHCKFGRFAGVQHQQVARLL